MALTQISTAGVKDDAVTSGKIPANAVGSSELADNAVDTNAIQDDAVTADKLANSINTSIAANTSKTTNATHTGDVTGSTSLTIANDAVTEAKIANGAVTINKLATNAVDNSKIGPQAVTLSRIENGTSSNDGKFLRANNGASPSYETVNTDLVSDTSPQLGGNLDTNNNSILLNDSNGTTNRILLGTASDMRIFHDGTTSRIDDLNGSDVEIRANDIRLQTNANVGAKSAVNCNQNAAVELFYNDVKQLETTENGILLSKGCIRGQGGSKVILGGTINPGNDTTWNFSFGTNDNGYNQGYIFNIKFYMNHWNGGQYYKYIESISGGRGNTTGLERLDLINNLGGSASSGWPNGHLDYSVSLTGGTRDGSNVSLFKVTYDADGTPTYTSGYYLEVSYSNRIGTITIT